MMEFKVMRKSTVNGKEGGGEKKRRRERRLRRRKKRRDVKAPRAHLFLGA